MTDTDLNDAPGIISFFETLVDDVSEPTSEYVLLNQGDTLIRHARPWEILKKTDSSKTRISGDDYTTAKALATDFDRPYKLYVGIGQAPLKRVRYEDWLQYKDMGGLYSIDFKNGNLYISNGTWTGTIYHTYIYRPLRLADTADATHIITPVYPEEFWPIYAYKMAEIQMGGVDFDAIASQSLPTWVRSYRDLWDSMVSWDADLKDEDRLSESYADNGLPTIDLGRLGS